MRQEVFNVLKIIMKAFKTFIAFCKVQNVKLRFLPAVKRENYHAH